MSGRRRKKDDNHNQGRGKARAPQKEDDNNKPRRPEPPPPPPQSLVTLLRKSKVVLAYFTALQENLNDDVTRWKEKARHYKSLYEEQKAENERLEQENQRLRQTKRASNKGDDDDDPSSEDAKPPDKKKRKRDNEPSKQRRRNNNHEEEDNDDEEDEVPPPAVAAADNRKKPANSDNNEEPPREITIQKANDDDSMFEIPSDSSQDDNHDGRRTESKTPKDSSTKQPGSKKPQPDTSSKHATEQPVTDAAFEFASSDDNDDSDKDNNQNKPQSPMESNKVQEKADKKEEEQKNDGTFEIYSSDDEAGENANSQSQANVAKAKPIEDEAQGHEEEGKRSTPVDSLQGKQKGKEKEAPTKDSKRNGGGGDKGANTKPIDDAAFDFSSSDDDGNDKSQKLAKETIRKNGSQPSRAPPKKAPRDKQQSIDDDAFKFYSSDDNNSDDDKLKKPPKPVSASHKNVAKQKTKSASKQIEDDDIDFYSSGDDDAGKRVDEDTPLPFWKQNQEYILSELVDAYRCLQHLGVTLVVKTTVKIADDKANDKNNNGIVDQDENNTSQPMDTEPADETPAEEGEDDQEGFSFLPDKADANALKRELVGKNKGKKISVDPTEQNVFERRANETVVTDMLFALRGLTRVQINIGGLQEEYQAFRMSPHWYPCGDKLPSTLQQPENEGKQNDDVDHPAYVGKVCLFRALSVMDAYCGPRSLSPINDQWEELFECKGLDLFVDPEWIESIKVGMRDRKEMVDHLVESLFGEISGNWGVTDRAMLVKLDYLFYQEDAGEEGGDNVEESASEPKKTNLEAQASAKSQSRLSALAERRIIAQLLVGLLLFRGDTHRAFQLVCNYVLSCVPAIELEDFPRVQPVLSLVCLEGLLLLDRDILSQCGIERKHDNKRNTGEASSSYFGRLLIGQNDDVSQSSRPAGNPEFLQPKILSTCIHATASIWRQRMQSPETRITDVARTEWACYLRLVKSQSFWLTESTSNNELEKASIHSLLEGYSRSLSMLSGEAVVKLERELVKGKVPGGITGYSVSYALRLALVANGDYDMVKTLLLRTIQQYHESKTQSGSFRQLCYACFVALRQLDNRQLDAYHQGVGSFLGSNTTVGDALSNCLASLHGKVQPTIDRQAAVPDVALSWRLWATFLDCCGLVADGDMVVEAIGGLLCFDDVKATTARKSSSSGLKTLLGSIETMSSVPTVRVINLKRRRDRMRLMMAQSRNAGVLVLKAVATLEDKAIGVDEEAGGTSATSDGSLHGGFAIDGKEKLEDLYAQIFPYGENSKECRRRLETYVAPKWRPHDLKAFDRFANDNEKALVRLSDSERSCALSHISAWKGVIRTLSNSDKGQSKYKSTVLQHGPGFRRLFLISGFARGLPLRQSPETADMPPCPVCVVLEDDAIMVDRFADRLDEILEELPRDFHFCSLGYSRPRTAPLVKFSKHVSIPTFLFYLTGYILSLDGAKYLLESLPVCGPIDSWIGLKMCQNWDNVFGSSMGLGKHTTTTADAPSRKDLMSIMRFRAFAAMIPLCAQTVGGGNLAASGNKWRQKDTDIVYSGSANYVG
ncbi:expressed unknown protein [Seminavis robusta]|uniref:Uncharacterized protein n=1 Tax=Seminavis robusta TaxID=568900 RepID=A0A9N8DXH8_9STRA|nr:expressed unknown protein [Seminavis robusta]|eukprot:Sro444_g144260.1 n/a (1557) ;mRNA; r:12257-17022